MAIQQGEIAARNAAAAAGKRLRRPSTTVCCSSGSFPSRRWRWLETTEALQKRGVPIIEASYPFNDHGKSMVMGELDGFVKMIGHAETGEILGACVVG